MNNGQPEIDDHFQDDSNAEDLLDDVLGGGDVIDDFHSLKGMISGALGSLGYKFSILVVLLFNFAYTAYNAFARSMKTDISVVSFNNCSCDPTAKVFYRSTTFGFAALWGVFLVIYALYNIWSFIKYHSQSQHSDCSNTDMKHHSNSSNTDDLREDSSDQERLIPGEHFWLLKRELKKLTAMVLSLNVKSLHSHKINSKRINVTLKGILTYMQQEFLVHSDPSENRFNFAFDETFKHFRYTLVIIQFFLRLPIVPLLLFQWLDEYSWNCVFGSIKDYCKETTVGYAFDQSMAISFLYTCVLLSIMNRDSGS